MRIRVFDLQIENLVVRLCLMDMKIPTEGMVAVSASEYVDLWIS